MQPPVQFEYVLPEPAAARDDASVAPTEAPPRTRRPRVVAIAVAAALVWSAGFALGRSGDSQSSLSAAVSSANLPAGSVAEQVNDAVVIVTNTLADGSGVAVGTGMVITSSGEVLTNNHVINGAGSVKVQIGGVGANRNAEVLGYDAADDVALLKIDGASKLKTIAIGDSTKVRVDDPVTAVGNALGKGGPPVAVEGAVTALNQTVTATDDSGANAETLTGMIQVDAQIQPGDSGGPLLNAQGAVIGMNSAAAVSGGFRQASTTAGFAIPINKVLSIARQIEAGKGTANIHIGQRALLGIQVQVSTTRSGSPSASTTAGAAVRSVQSGGPAEKAGLAAGDTIVSIDGDAIGSPSQLTTALFPHHPGDKVDVGWVDSSGKSHHATVTLVEGPPA